MLLSEMPDARFERASSILEWRFRPERLTTAAVDFAVECWRPRPASGRRSPSVGETGGVPLYRDEAVVLRTHKLGEADRIITLLTRRHGRVRAVAKGVRRTTSRWGSRLEPFTHVDLQLAEGRSLDVITQAETLDPFNARLGLDYERYTAGTAMLETAERLVTEDKEPAVQQFLLLVGGLRAMSAGEHPAGQVLDSYLLRSLSVAGYAPSFDHCVRLRRRGAAPLLQPLRRRRDVHGRQAARVCHPGAGDRRRPLGPAGRRLAGRARDRAATPARGQHPGLGLPRLAPRARAALDGVRRALSPLAG